MCIIPYQSLVYMVGVHWGLTGDFDFLSANLESIKGLTTLGQKAVVLKYHLSTL